VSRHATLAALVAAAALGLSALAGQGGRAALIGAGISSGTAVASLVAFARVGRSPVKPLQKALAIFVVMFLVRILLVALGVVAVVRAGGSVLAFATAFFVPYFIFAAIEGSYVHALGRGIGKTA
jgi:hypothetical protein